MAIQVELEDHTGNVQQLAKLADDASVGDLIPAIITALGLPITDPSGRRITYHLSYQNRQLQEDETLESAGVQTGDSLTIVPEMTAGHRVDEAQQLAADLIAEGWLDRTESDLLQSLGESLVEQDPGLYPALRGEHEGGTTTWQRRRKGLINVAKNFLKNQERVFYHELCDPNGRCLKANYRQWLQAGNSSAAAAGVISAIGAATGIAAPAVLAAVALWIVRVELETWCRGDVDILSAGQSSHAPQSSATTAEAATRQEPVVGGHAGDQD
jgi:WXG100 protein secretion system (Wss), protein YukD